ncbi:MAG TPA: YdeI/OmpD-associated family protein [Chloroflexota bacterium]
MHEFTTIAEGRKGGGITITLPFDPAVAWGDRARYDITGTIDDHGVRGKLTERDGAHVLELGPAWCRDRRVAPGAQVSVALRLEGPQVTAMADDIASALAAEPEARRFFESLATFYRKNFMRWIESAKQPETRARRIAEMVATLKAGKRER